MEGDGKMERRLAGGEQGKGRSGWRGKHMPTRGRHHLDASTGTMIKGDHVAKGSL